MEIENHQQITDSGITTNEKIDNTSIIQVESVLNQIINIDSVNNQSLTLNNEKSDRKKTIYKIMTFVALQVALSLSALDTTIVSTILPHVGSEFNQMSIASWVATSYILTYDAFQPIFAKFSDIFGRKWTLMTAISIFLFGSLLCGVSTSMIMLIVSRAIAGIGAAGISPSVFIIISEIIPLEKRGSYEGIPEFVFAMASIMGPLIGGSFTDNISWRWCFYINLPIGGIAILLLYFFLDLPTKKSSLMDKLKRIDYLGTLIILTAAILFLLALNLGSSIYPWTSVAVLVPLILSLILIILFIIVESKFAKEPIVPLRLFKNKSSLGAILTCWWFGFSFISFVYYLPIYFQIIKGDSAMISGIRLFSMQLPLSVASFSTGFLITKLQIYRPFVWFGTSLLTLSIGLVSIFDVNTEFSMIYGISIIVGISMGILFAANIIAIQASVEPKDIAVGIGFGSFARLLGASISVAISGSILNSGLNNKLSAVLPSEYVDIILQQSFYIHHGLPQQYKMITIQAYCDSFRNIWYFLTPITAFSIFSALLIQHRSLNASDQKDTNYHHYNNNGNNN